MDSHFDGIEYCVQFFSFFLQGFKVNNEIIKIQQEIIQLSGKNLHVEVTQFGLNLTQNKPLYKITCYK